MSEFYKREGVTVETVDPYHAASLEKQGFEKVSGPEAAAAEGAPAKAKRSRPSRAKTDKAPATEPETDDESESEEVDDLIGDSPDGDEEAL